MHNKNKLIDLSYLNEISNGNKEFIIELIDLFFDQIPKYQESLQDFYEKEDWVNIGKIAHKAKSSILMVGLNELASKLKRLEENAKESKNINEYSEIIAKFVRDSNIAINELKEIRENNIN